MESGYVLSSMPGRSHSSWLPGQKKTLRNLGLFPARWPVSVPRRPPGPLPARPRVLAHLRARKACLSAFIVSPTSPATMSTSFRKAVAESILHHPMLPF